MIEIKKVSKKYRNEYALQDVSLIINKGVNFIVGPSGSGKTTLLKLMSGMDQDFEGEIFCFGKSIKELSTIDKSNFYNNVFGFVWQDFNLIEEFSVWDNIMIPAYLKESNTKQMAIKVLRELKIQTLTHKKVKDLSGGQKQRVVLARELMKNPAIIIADEPTSALDTNTSKMMLDLLRSIAKKRTVIIVTHDTSLIQENDTVFRLDKGKLIESNFSKATVAAFQLPIFKKISWHNSFILAKRNIFNKWGKSLVNIISLLLAGILLLTTFSGVIGKGTNAQFENLLDKYGKTLLDIQVVDSFMSASGTDGDKDDPKADVNQDIAGLYNQYNSDERVDFILFMQAFNEIEISMNGKKYKIENSGSTPSMTDLISGKMPGAGNEVVVPESFLKKAGKDKESILGTEIEFNGSIYNWTNNQPVPKKTKITVKIVGVVDTSISSEFEGKKYDYTLDDAFFFSKDALDTLRQQAELTDQNLDFIMRAKTMEDLISLKNELNKQGIVPIGQFELVEDFVKLDNQSAQQSDLATVIIGVSAVVVLGSVFFVTGFMRKREYAIYKISGYHNSHLWQLSLIEMSIYGCSSIIIMFLSSPLLSMLTSQFFGISIMSLEMLLMGSVFIIISSLLAYLINALILTKTNVISVLKAGTRS